MAKKKSTAKTVPATSGPVDLTGVSLGEPRAEAADTTPRGYEPSYEEIAEEAYRRYLNRGGSDGRDFEDWLEAERDLRSRR
jgi:hypothetical protein